MRVLILDDLRTIRFPGADEIIHARTVVEAVAALMQHDHIDVLVLDHDLGPDSAKRLISYLQMKVVEGEPHEIGEVRIISSNPQAHLEFPLALTASGYTVKPGLGPIEVDLERTALLSTAAREVDRACNPYDR